MAANFRNRSLTYAIRRLERGRFGAEQPGKPRKDIQHVKIDAVFDVCAIFRLAKRTVDDIAGMFVPEGFIEVPENQLSISAG